VGSRRTPAKGALMPKLVHECQTGKVGIGIAYFYGSTHMVFIRVKSV